MLLELADRGRGVDKEDLICVAPLQLENNPARSLQILPKTSSAVAGTKNALTDTNVSKQVVACTTYCECHGDSKHQ